MFASPPLHTNRFISVDMENQWRKDNKESNMKKLDAEKNEKIEDLKQQADEHLQDNIFITEEIRIEELAIDGICGVY